mgnify:FL=1
MNGDDEILQITLSQHDDDCTLALVQETVYESLSTITTILVISIKNTTDLNFSKKYWGGHLNDMKLYG